MTDPTTESINAQIITRPSRMQTGIQLLERTEKLLERLTFELDPADRKALGKPDARIGLELRVDVASVRQSISAYLDLATGRTRDG